MALAIPIISSFDETGVKKAIKQFQQLETTSEKAQFAIKKAAIPAAAALAGVTAGLVDCTKAAMEDVAAQEKLAGQLARTTGATDAQIKANEDWISAQGRLLGFTDNQLRPALSKLATQTHDLAEAQKGVSLAMDIATATGKPLEAVTTALEKAYGGNMGALKKLSPEVGAMIKGGMDLDGVMGVLSKTFGGAASEAANTAEGKFKRLGIALGETKESIGTSLLPVVEAVLPYLQAMSDWAAKNPGVFKIIALAIGGIALAILAINTAMALNPFTAILVGIGLLVAGIAIAYTKFEGFRNLVKTVVNGLSDYFEFMANAWIKVTNVLITGINLISPFTDIPHIGSVSFGHIGGDGVGSGYTSARQAEDAMFGGGGKVAATAPTVITSAPSIGKSGGSGTTNKEPYVPYISMADMAPHIVPLGVDPTAGGLITGGLPDITINIDTLFADPAEIGRQVVASLSAYQNRSGPLPLAVA